MTTYNHAPREEAIPGSLDEARRTISAHAADEMSKPPAVVARLAGILAVITALGAAGLANRDTDTPNPAPMSNTADSQG